MQPKLIELPPCCPNSSPNNYHLVGQTVNTTLCARGWEFKFRNGQILHNVANSSLLLQRLCK